MPEVRLRNTNEANGYSVGEVPFNEEAIDRVLPLLNKWGVRHEGTYYRADTMSGTFVIEDARAFFEVEFGEEE